MQPVSYTHLDVYKRQPGIVKDKFLHTHDREDCVMEFEMGIAQVGKAH